MNRSKLKKSARAALIGNYGTLIAVHVLIALSSFVLTAVFDNAGIARSPVPAAIARIIIFLLTLMLQAGTVYLYLEIARGNRPGVKDMFYFSSRQPDRIILISVFVSLRALLNACPAIIPGFVLRSLSRTGRYSRPLMMAGIILSGIAALALALPVLLDYAPVFCIYTDHPEQSVREDLEQSRQMMRGYRLFYLRLLLSFLGLYLLSLLTFGIASFWLDPYLSETAAQFYLRRLRMQESESSSLS